MAIHVGGEKLARKEGRKRWRSWFGRTRKMKNRPVERKVEERLRGRRIRVPKSPRDVLATRFRVVVEERERGRGGGGVVTRFRGDIIGLFRMQPWFASIPLVLYGASSPGASAASVERQPTSLIDWHVYYCDGERGNGGKERGPVCIYIFSILNDWSPAYYH